MNHIDSRQRYPFFSVLFCLFLLLSACSQLSDKGLSSNSSPTQMATSTTTSTLGQAQSCPASASARPAIMLPLSVNNHPNLVYVSQQGDNSVLQRYDALTGSRQIILQTLTSETIQRANISPDGQWILLQSLLQGQIAIQLIRLDGQHLQTLYCAPPQDTIDDALLSPDQHALVFNQEDTDGLSTLYLLDVGTGKLRTELSPLQPNYPGIAQGQLQTIPLVERIPSTVHDKTIDKFTMQLFNPLPSRLYLIYVPMKWANNTSVYLFGTIHASGAPFHQLALLRDTRKDVTQQASNLQRIVTDSQDSACLDDDVTPNNSQLVCSTYTFTAPVNPPNAITMWPISGGTHRIVYQGLLRERIIARAISNSTLVFLFTRASGLLTLWKVNTDGSGLAQLMTAQTIDADLEFASSSYLPWSVASRDAGYYALTMYTMTGNTSALLVGDFNGGQPETIASSAASLLLAGWA